ncbi:MAG: YqzL family protein [Bacilli bacterium]|nr:YqzL family protein [Bacilli bacterium]
MENLLWNLFKKTGNIKYYLLYNEYKGINNERNNRGNNSK